MLTSTPISRPLPPEARRPGVGVGSGLPARDRPLLAVAAAAAAGIFCDRYGALAAWTWTALAGCALGLAVLCYCRGRGRWASGLVLLSVAALGGLWHHDRQHLYSAGGIERYCRVRSVPVLARLAALDAPRLRRAADEGPMSTLEQVETTRLEVRVESLRGRASWRPVAGRAVLIVEGDLRALRIRRGDRLEVAASLLGVRPALNPGEPDFAGMCRARRQTTVLLCEHERCVRRVGRGSRWSLLRQLGNWRVSAEAALEEHVGPQRAPLAAALLLGSREQLDPQTVEALFCTGTLHMLAISGLHVGILASVCWGLLRLQWVPRHRLLWGTGGWIVCYALITGARPPVVRAATLVVLYCMARGWNRSAYAWNALGAAGVVALAIRPAGLFDTGTQLSFLAVATLMAVWPLLRGTPPSTPLERLLAATRPLWLRCCWAVIGHAGRLLLVSAVVWLVSLPLVALRFHMIAPLGIALNVLLWLPLAAALLLALLTVISSPLPWIPGLCGLMCDTCLSLIELSTGQAARWSIAHVASAGAAGWWVTLFYVALAAWQFLPLPVPRRWWLALLGVWLTVAVAEGAAGRQLWHTAGRPPLRLSFIAVGHGTSVLVELPDGRVLLYDAGSMGRPSAAALPISSVLWARRVSHLDALVLSHADADHFNAVGQLLQRFSVGVVYVSPAMFQGQDPALQALRHAIRQAQVPLAHLTEGQLLQCGAGVRVEALHPPREDAPESGDRMPATGTGDGAPPVRDPGRSPRRSDNSQSIVLRIRCQALDCLLTGDLEGDGLDELLAEQPEPVGVLMAPHHGSLHSEPRRLVAWGAPQAVVISAGANVPRSVLDAYAAAGAAVFWTDRDGMIEVSSATTGIEIRSWRGERRWLPARP